MTASEYVADYNACPEHMYEAYTDGDRVIRYNLKPIKSPLDIIQATVDRMAQPLYIWRY